MSSERPVRAWALGDADKPLTYSTSCWWCGYYVYFYRDKNGGCVLFDDLGPPWPIHDCWKDHMRQSQISRTVESGLVAVGFDGTFYPPQGVKITKPRKGETDVVLSGYVADNHVLYEPPKVFRLRSHRRAASIRLVLLEVSAGREIHPFVIPAVNAQEIPNFSFIEIRGTWKRKGRRWYLLTTSLRRMEPRKRRGQFSAQFALSGECADCGCKLTKNVSWGLDDKGLEECSLCGAMRGNMTRETFLKHILSIRTQHAQHL